MSNIIIAQGAEAKIFLSGKNVIKDRIPKTYRHPELDVKIRKRRTKSEIKILKKAEKIIPVPKIINSEDYTITMQYIKGEKLSDHLGKLKNSKEICKQIGKSIAKLHDAGLIHGDLTTSNMILKDKKVYFIDFGLGFHSDRIEDKAVDLHLIKQALEAKHSKHFKEYFKAILKGYKKSKDYSTTIKRLEVVEKRGRYKKQK